MKILHFLKNFIPLTNTFIYQEVTGLAINHEVAILTTNRVNEIQFPFENVTVVNHHRGNVLDRIFRTLQGWDIESSFRNQAFRKGMLQTIAEVQPDVIHCHFGWESWLVLMNLEEQKIPIFIHFHGFDASFKLESKRYVNTLKRLFARKDVTPIFCSDTMRKAVEAKVGNIEHGHVLYYGTDISRFNRTQVVENQIFTFLQISSFAEKKGHIYTINAFAKFLKDNPSLDAKLQFAGVGEYFEAMKILVNTLNLNEKVIFLGAVNQDEAKRLLEQSNCFVHHSITAENGDQEGIPNAIMEAMAMQLPILSTRHSGIPELVADGVNGYLVAEKDVNDYALKMKKILSWSLKPENRVVVETKFERNQHVARLEKIYKSHL